MGSSGLQHAGLAGCTTRAVESELGDGRSAKRRALWELRSYEISAMTNDVAAARAAGPTLPIGRQARKSAATAPTREGAFHRAGWRARPSGCVLDVNERRRRRPTEHGVRIALRHRVIRHSDVMLVARRLGRAGGRPPPMGPVAPRAPMVSPSTPSHPLSD